MDALKQGPVQGQSQGQELGQAMPMSGTAGSATTTQSTPALQALVLWAQYLLKHRSQELSLSELIRRIYALSPLPQPIRYRYQISLSPRTQNIAQVKLLPSGQVEISVFSPSLVSLDGPLPLEFLQDLNLHFSHNLGMDLSQLFVPEDLKFGNLLLQLP